MNNEWDIILKSSYILLITCIIIIITLFFIYVVLPQTAWYPDKPRPDEEQHMSQFMEALAIFYPCTYCAEDFQINLKMSPVQ